MNKKTYIIGGIILAVLVVAIIVAVIKNTESFQSQKSSCEDSDKPYYLLFFHMDGCGHCTEFKPVWREFLSKIKDDPVTQKVCITDVPASDEAALRLYGVWAFPTVLLVNHNDKSLTPYEGERSVKGLLNFVKTIK